jgi:hypothetical protein
MAVFAGGIAKRKCKIPIGAPGFAIREASASKADGRG